MLVLTHVAAAAATAAAWCTEWRVLRGVPRAACRAGGAYLIVSSRWLLRYGTPSLVPGMSAEPLNPRGNPRS